MTQTEATRVHVRGDRAVAVESAGGDVISAGRAVIASVTPRHLFGRLVLPEDIPPGFLRRIGRFSYGPGTFVLHLALQRPLAWRAAEDLAQFNTVHIGATLDDLARAYSHTMAGLLPEHPLLAVSQATAVDPSRAPAGRHVARIHVRAVPSKIEGDAAGRIAERDWDAAKERFADRLIDLLQVHAPNIRDVLLARHAMSPIDLERENPNLVGGDCCSGSYHLSQNYFCRPVPGWSRYATPIRSLFMIGASTWPGASINATSGYLLAQRLLSQ